MGRRTDDEIISSVPRGTIPSFQMSSEEALLLAKSITDALGKGLDGDMLEPIAACQRLGIKTTGSCQGHKDRGLSYPWIDVETTSSERDFLLQELPLFHLVKKGTKRFPLSYQLVPREIKDITSTDPRLDWSRHRAELQEFSHKFLRD
jgi:hypothetical protein